MNGPNYLNLQSDKFNLPPILTLIVTIPKLKSIPDRYPTLQNLQMWLQIVFVANFGKRTLDCPIHHSDVYLRVQ